MHIEQTTIHYGTLSELSNRPTLDINQHPKATRVSELDSIVLATLIIGGNEVGYIDR